MRQTIEPRFSIRGLSHEIHGKTHNMRDSLLYSDLNAGLISEVQSGTYKNSDKLILARLRFANRAYRPSMKLSIRAFSVRILRISSYVIPT